MAGRVLQVTWQHRVPLIINNDVQTCLAVGAEGVHIGQDDIKLSEARQRLGQDVIIGVTFHRSKRQPRFCGGGADYLGIGTMVTTPIKTDTNPSSELAGHEMVDALARSERCVVLMTGKFDYLTDGTRVYEIHNGSHWLGRITGSGCAWGSVVVSYIALHKADKLYAALAGLLHYEIAAEQAEAHVNTDRPGSFIPAFLDALYLLGNKVKDGSNDSILRKAKVVGVSQKVRI